jgi:hypothetical protein
VNDRPHRALWTIVRLLDGLHGGAAKNLDWFSSDLQASAVCGGAEAAERDLDPRLVTSGCRAQGRYELVDGGGQPISLKSGLRGLAAGNVHRHAAALSVIQAHSGAV